MWCSGVHHDPMSSVNTLNALSIGASTTIDVVTDVSVVCVVIAPPVVPLCI